MKLLLLIVSGVSTFAQISATIAIDTTHSTALNPNFSGFNDEVPFPPEFYDYRLNNLAAQLTPGWVRYPSGLFSDAFNWQTGEMVSDWVAQFQGTSIETLLSESVAWVGGKGGGSFVDAAIRANFLGAKLIVDVNAYTDTPASAGAMAAFAKANHIPVAVWELANEPYFFKSFFASGIDYVTKVKPYRDAIKPADPNAIVAIFFDDAGDTDPNPAWDKSIASYKTPYWDAVTYHHYPPESTGPFSQWMADENAVLASKSSAFVTGHLQPLNPPGMKFVISEFLPSSDGLASGTSLTDGTLYGAIYAAEYVMRMSSVPSMLYVGPHAMTGLRGVDAANAHYNDVLAAYNAGATIDTLTLNFGYYFSAQPLGVALLNGVLRNATQVESTTVTGGATVAATGLGQIPALYAQAYSSATGQQSVVITNKSATAHQLTIQLNGAAISGTMAVYFIAGSDPTLSNSPSKTNVAIQGATSTNPVTVPAYSVVRVDFSPPPVIAVVSSANFAAGPVASQEIVSLFASAIPASLAGNAVLITDGAGNTQAAQIFSAASGFANILLPGGLAPGAGKISIAGSTPLAGPITIAKSAPGLYSADADGAGVAAANAFVLSSTDQQTNETVYTCDANFARSCLPTPLALGNVTDTLFVVLYGTGIRGAASVQCFVAGTSVPVLYAGANVDPGLDQVNISVPRSLAGSGDVRVYLVADGVQSNAVSLKIQ